MVLLAGILAIVGIIVTIFLVQRQQELRGRAEKATILSLSPASQNVDAGEEGKLEVIVNPGVNQVNFIKTAIVYDQNAFEIKREDVKLNPALGWSFVEQPSLADGTLTFTVAVGSDPTLVISKTTQKLVTITFKVKDDAGDGDSDFTFDVDNTQVRSVGAGDPFTENVLSSALGATVLIGAPICRANIGTCTWESTDLGVSFRYRVIDTEDDSVITEGETDKKKVEFPTTPGKTYRCEVTAFSVCGESPEALGTSKCPTPSPTPTPSVSPSPRPEKSPTPTPTGEVPTQTPAPTEEITPSPTEKVVLTTVPSLPPQGGEISTPAAGGTTTPVPTLPPTGNPYVVGGILGGILFILGGLALLFL